MKMTFALDFVDLQSWKLCVFSAVVFLTARITPITVKQQLKRNKRKESRTETCSWQLRVRPNK